MVPVYSTSKPLVNTTSKVYVPAAALAGKLAKVVVAQAVLVLVEVASYKTMLPAPAPVITTEPKDPGSAFKTLKLVKATPR
jgi:hypothetical protein